MAPRSESESERRPLLAEQRWNLISVFFCLISLLGSFFLLSKQDTVSFKAMGIFKVIELQWPFLSYNDLNNRRDVERRLSYSSLSDLSPAISNEVSLIFFSLHINSFLAMDFDKQWGTLVIIPFHFIY